ncbi:MAG: hypothetical protein AAFP90_21945, partial [Planctomycetota bacterium]
MFLRDASCWSVLLLIGLCGTLSMPEARAMPQQAENKSPAETSTPTNDENLGPAALVRRGDTIALLGGAMMEACQTHAAIELPIQLTLPRHQIRVRNLAWSGDDLRARSRAVFDGPSDPAKGMQRLLKDIRTAQPSVLVLGYGQSTAMDVGDQPDDLESMTARFGSDLRALIERISQSSSNAENGDTPTVTPPRILLLTPVIIPGVRVAQYRSAVVSCRRVMQEVAAETPGDVRLVSLPINLLMQNELGDVVSTIPARPVLLEWGRAISEALTG